MGNASAIIGKKCMVKTDYMEKPVYGVIKRIRIEVETEIGKTTLVNANAISNIVIVKEE